MIYKLRDLGYYGEFNERDVSRICHSHPKLKHFFQFIKDQLNSGTEGNVLTQADLDTEQQVLSELNMTCVDVEDKTLEKDLVRMLGLPDPLEQESS